MRIHGQELNRTPMDKQFVQDGPATIQYLIRARLKDQRELNDWSVRKCRRVDIDVVKLPYIQIWFKYSPMKYQYASNLAFDRAKEALREIFGSDMIWFQIPKNRKMDMEGHQNEFWITINDIDHKDTWHRIK